VANFCARFDVGGLKVVVGGGMPVAAARDVCRDEVLRRICGEYFEMPGLQLSLDQASQLWGLERTAREAHLTALVEAGFLVCTKQRVYVRVDLNIPPTRARA
jgi:hypothetical protein